MNNLPIACTLTASEIQKRRADLLPGLLARAESREAMPGGYRIRFKPSEDLLAAIAETIETERQCCRFLRFVLTVEPDEAAIVLDVTGPPGTPEFLEGVLSAS